MRVFKLMQEQGGGDDDKAMPVALAIHWGTFIADLAEGKRSLRRLRKACHEYDVQFARHLPPASNQEDRIARIEQLLAAKDALHQSLHLRASPIHPQSARTHHGTRPEDRSVFTLRFAATLTSPHSLRQY